MPTNKVTLFRYIKASDPVPPGWRVADDLKGTIHNPLCEREGRNFVLIVREKKE
jgi:hypothetical protein